MTTINKQISLGIDDGIDERVHKSDDRMKRTETTLKNGEIRFKDHDDEIKEIWTWKNEIMGALTLMGIFTQRDNCVHHDTSTFDNKQHSIHTPKNINIIHGII